MDDFKGTPWGGTPLPNDPIAEKLNATYLDWCSDEEHRWIEAKLHEKKVTRQRLMERDKKNHETLKIQQHINAVEAADLSEGQYETYQAYSDDSPEVWDVIKMFGFDPKNLRKLVITIEENQPVKCTADTYAFINDEPYTGSQVLPDKQMTDDVNQGSYIVKYKDRERDPRSRLYRST